MRANQRNALNGEIIPLESIAVEAQPDMVTPPLQDKIGPIPAIAVSSYEDSIRPIGLPLQQNKEGGWHLPTKRSRTGCSCSPLNMPQELPAEKEHMLTKGWCIHQISYLSRILDKNAFSFLSQQHLARETDHALCLENSSCVAYNVDMNQYNTRHVTENCTCEMVSVSVWRIDSNHQRWPLPSLFSRLQSGPLERSRFACTGGGCFPSILQSLMSGQTEWVTRRKMHFQHVKFGT